MSGEVVKEAGATWSSWPERSLDGCFTVGVEEEIMLLDRRDWSLSQSADDLLPRFPAEVCDRVAPETHASALEIGTAVCSTADEAATELAELRAALRDTAAGAGLSVASSGTHPMATWQDVALGGGDRQAEVHDTVRELAHREPTSALHVHVGLPDADEAVRVFNRMRVHLPLLLALSANSPYWQGRDTGLASVRTPLFQAFPRVGIPRRFASYEEWVRAVDLLVGCEAFPDASYLWWDVRMVPRYGTLEIRIMDAQIDLASTATLVALVQCLARMELHEGWGEAASHAPQEVWDENRFIAARDGIDARLIVATDGVRVPVADRVAELLPRLRPHAQDLGCVDELEGVEALVRRNGAVRQRALATRSDGLPGLVAALAEAF